jgi:hypothetical protein
LPVHCNPWNLYHQKLPKGCPPIWRSDSGSSREFFKATGWIYERHLTKSIHEPTFYPESRSMQCNLALHRPRIFLIAQIPRLTRRRPLVLAFRPPRDNPRDGGHHCLRLRRSPCSSSYYSSSFVPVTSTHIVPRRPTFDGMGRFAIVGLWGDFMASSFHIIWVRAYRPLNANI